MDVAEIASSDETAEVENASMAVDRDQWVAVAGCVVENVAEETVGVIVPDENAMDEECECEGTDQRETITADGTWNGGKMDASRSCDWDRMGEEVTGSLQEPMSSQNGISALFDRF